MAPDVEMRLSFPKKNGKTDSETSSINRKITNFCKQENGNYQSFQREQSDVSNENYQLNNRAALPTTAGSANINPKRTLSKAVVGKKTNFSFDYLSIWKWFFVFEFQIKIEIYEITIFPI